jgi:hypothetical protein
MVGQSASAHGMEAPFVSDSWTELLGTVDPKTRWALNMGVGAGLTAPCDLRLAQLAAARTRPLEEREAVYYGIGRALGARAGALSLDSLSGVEEADSVWASAGEALRASGRGWADVAAEVSDSVKPKIAVGFLRPGGGPWETRLVDELPTLQPILRADCSD